MAERKRKTIPARDVKKGDYAPHTRLTVKDVVPSQFRGKDMTIITFESDEQYMYRSNRSVTIEREVEALALGTVACSPGSERVFKTSYGWVNIHGGSARSQEDSFWREYVVV